MSEERDFSASSIEIQPEKKKWHFHVPAGFVVFLLLAGFLTFMFFQTSDHHVKGKITLATPDKTWTMNVSSCNSGQRREFFGVEFFDDKQEDIAGRITMPVDGNTRISINRPDANYAISYGKEDCKVWDVDLQRTNTQYNNIWSMTGHAKFDCATTDETESHATGDVEFLSCH